MLSISLLLTCALASTVSAEVACAADTVPDGGDDSCLLLQKEAGVVKHDGADHQVHLVKAEQHAASAAKEADDDAGFPDFFKKLAGKAGAAFGGVEKLEKDFEGIKTAVETFSKEAHDAMAHLTAKHALEDTIVQVEAAYMKIHDSAVKLHSALSKATSDFLSGVGKIAPAHFTSAMNSTLQKIDKDAASFANSFKQSALALKEVDRKKVCSHVQHGLDAMHNSLEALAGSALGISTKGLDKKVMKAKDALPGPIKKEIEKVLHKANEAAEQLKSSLNPTVQEISHGVAGALKGHCSELKSGAGHTEVGLLSAFVVFMLGFSV